MEFVHSESGEPIAVVIADPALDRYRGLFDVAVRTSALALQTAQAQADAAQAKLAEVRAVPGADHRGGAGGAPADRA